METKIFQVIELIKRGLTIQQALKSLSINRRTFYRNITKEDKVELMFHKAANCKSGQGGQGYVIKNLHDSFNNNNLETE